MTLTVHSRAPVPDEFLKRQLNQSILSYTIRAKLGEGGFGKVYIAEAPASNANANALVAIKVIPCGKITESHLMDFLASELDVLRQLSATGSLYFPQLYAGMHDKFNFYIITDYLSGGSLADEIDSGPMESDRIRLVMAQLVVCLTMLRKASIVHRDLKPDNIMLDALGNITLIDFGLARHFPTEAFEQNLALGWDTDCDDALLTQTHCGTLPYMAPETVAGLKYSFEIDVYALGVIFYEMLFGDRPFAADERKSIQEKILFSDWIVPANLDVDLTALDLLGGLLQKRPNKRISVEDLKAHTFFKGVDWEAVASRSYELATSHSPCMDAAVDDVLNHHELIDWLVRPLPPFGEQARMQRPLKDMFNFVSEQPLVPRPSKICALKSSTEKILGDVSLDGHADVKKLWPRTSRSYVTRIEAGPVQVQPRDVDKVAVGDSQPVKGLTDLEAASVESPLERTKPVFSAFDCSIVLVDDNLLDASLPHIQLSSLPLIPVQLAANITPCAVATPIVSPQEHSPLFKDTKRLRPAPVRIARAGPPPALKPVRATLSPPSLTLSDTLSTSSGGPKTPTSETLKVISIDFQKKKRTRCMEKGNKMGTFWEWMKIAASAALPPRPQLAWM